MKTLRAFQQETVDKFRDQIGLLNADECGLGKTITGIEAVKAVCSAHSSILLLCPPSLIAQWRSVIQDQWPGISTTESNYIPFDYAKFDDLGWVLMSYYELYKPYIRDSLRSIVWDCVVADEAHRFRSHKAKLFKYVHNIPKVRGIALTATPIEHGQHELWALLHFLRPDKFPAYWPFVKRYFVVEEGWFTKWEIMGPKDPNEVAELVEPYMIQHKKLGVAPELPERIDIPMHVEMPLAQRELYDVVRSHPDIVLDIQDQRLLLQNALTVLTRLQQISSWPNLLGLSGPSAKLTWLDEFLLDHPNDRVIMFTRFRVLADFLQKTKDAALIAGGINEVTEFKAGRRQHAVCVIADSLQGVDGLQTAQHAVFVDSHWSYTQMTQAIDRIHRMDVTEPKNVYMLESTREDRLVYEAIEKKWAEQELLNYLLKELRNANT